MLDSLAVKVISMFRNDLPFLGEGEWLKFRVFLLSIRL